MQSVTYRFHPVSIFVLCVGLVWIIVTRQVATPVVVTTTNQLIPELVLTTATGERVRTTQQVGQPTIYVLWASWCPPCRAELPMVQHTAASLRSQGIAVILVNQGEAPVDVVPWLHAQQLTLPNWYDTERLFAQSFQAPDLPSTVFVDARGHVDLVYRGPITNEIIDTMRIAWQQETGAP